MGVNGEGARSSRPWVKHSFERQVPVGDLRANSGKNTFTYGMGGGDAQWSYGVMVTNGGLAESRGATLQLRWGSGTSESSERLVITIFAGEYNKRSQSGLSS